MSMAALPHAYLTWTASTEPLATFLRYQVYRRAQGETAWLKLARITDRGISYYQDYLAGSGVTYEYAVTQVSDVAGEEVESAFPAPVSAALVIRSLFLHDVASPSNYAEIRGQATTLTLQPSVEYVQPWGRTAPVAHVGGVQAYVLDVSMTDSWDGQRDVWRAIANLMTRQRENGAVLMARQMRDVRLFVAIDSADRDDRTQVLYSAGVRLREVYHREDVD